MRFFFTLCVSSVLVFFALSFFLLNNHFVKVYYTTAHSIYFPFLLLFCFGVGMFYAFLLSFPKILQLHFALKKAKKQIKSSEE